jgi:hypothetical protein
MVFLAELIKIDKIGGYVSIFCCIMYYSVAQKMVHENVAWSPLLFEFSLGGSSRFFPFSCTIYFGPRCSYLFLVHLNNLSELGVFLKCEKFEIF